MGTQVESLIEFLERFQLEFMEGILMELMEEFPVDFSGKFSYGISGAILRDLLVEILVKYSQDT